MSSVVVEQGATDFSPYKTGLLQNVTHGLGHSLWELWNRECQESLYVISFENSIKRITKIYVRFSGCIGGQIGHGWH